ncbi:MAG: sulfotransferase [Pseudomonadota bacterium]|nr:sulfotransferase [Pseudomonadota bacterium]
MRESAEEALSVELSRLAALMDGASYVALESAARELLCEHPQSGHAWQMLGVALAKQGKDARHAWARAAHCLPDDAVAHLNLGNALGRVGLLQEAQASYARALAIRPEFAEAHLNLSDVLLELGQPKDAIVSCRRALELSPMLAGAHQKLGMAHVIQGNVLRGIGRLDEAAAQYRQALLIVPHFVAAHVQLGTVLRLQRRSVECEASCHAALLLDSRSTAALAVLAELRADSGRFAEAEELYKRVIAIDPGSWEALAGLAHLRRMTAADRAWLTAAQPLAEQQLLPHAEMALRYAMGKYFDDLGDFDNAFPNYQRANDLAKRCGPQFDRAFMSRNIDLIIRTLDQSWINHVRRSASVSTRPVFIVGMLRSGTTLAEQILASHPAVFGAGELAFWGTAASAALADVAAAGAAAAKGIIDDAGLAGLGHDYLQLLQNLSADAQRVVDKFPTNFLFLGLIHAALPHARIIHMRRNAIDTCLSIYFQRFEAANAYAKDFEDLSYYYREYRRVMQHWRSVLPADALLEVPYEGLVEEPALWSRKMVDFIELPWDSRCLNFHQTERTVVTASRWQVRQKISASSIERWRNYEKFLRPIRSLMDLESLSHT